MEGFGCVLFHRIFPALVSFQYLTFGDFDFLSLFSCFQFHLFGVGKCSLPLLF